MEPEADRGVLDDDALDREGIEEAKERDSEVEEFSGPELASFSRPLRVRPILLTLRQKRGWMLEGICQDESDGEGIQKPQAL